MHKYKLSIIITTHVMSGIEGFKTCLHSLVDKNAEFGEYNDYELDYSDKKLWDPIKQKSMVKIYKSFDKLYGGEYEWIEPEEKYSQTQNSFEIIVVIDNIEQNPYVPPNQEQTTRLQAIIDYCDLFNAEIRERNLNIGFRRYIHNTKRRVSTSRNLGIAKSQGQYITMCDDDDIHLNGYKMIELIEKTNNTPITYCHSSTKDHIEKFLPDNGYDIIMTEIISFDYGKHRDFRNKDGSFSKKWHKLVFGDKCNSYEQAITNNFKPLIKTWFIHTQNVAFIFKRDIFDNTKLRSHYIDTISNEDIIWFQSLLFTLINSKEITIQVNQTISYIYLFASRSQNDISLSDLNKQGDIILLEQQSLNRMQKFNTRLSIDYQYTVLDLIYNNLLYHNRYSSDQRLEWESKDQIELPVMRIFPTNNIIKAQYTSSRASHVVYLYYLTTRPHMFDPVIKQLVELNSKLHDLYLSEGYNENWIMKTLTPENFIEDSMINISSDVYSLLYWYVNTWDEPTILQMFMDLDEYIGYVPINQSNASKEIYSLMINKDPSLEYIQEHYSLRVFNEYCWRYNLWKQKHGIMVEIYNLIHKTIHYADLIYSMFSSLRLTQRNDKHWPLASFLGCYSNYFNGETEFDLNNPPKETLLFYDEIINEYIDPRTFINKIVDNNRYENLLDTPFHVHLQSTNVLYKIFMFIVPEWKYEDTVFEMKWQH